MFDELKNAIRNVIKENGKQEITGDILQDVLIAMLDAISKVLPGGFVLLGVANADTVPPAVLDRTKNYCYLFLDERIAGNEQIGLDGFGISDGIEPGSVGFICHFANSNEWQFIGSRYIPNVNNKYSGGMGLCPPDEMAWEKGPFALPTSLLNTESIANLCGYIGVSAPPIYIIPSFVGTVVDFEQLLDLEMEPIPIIHSQGTFPNSWIDPNRRMTGSSSPRKIREKLLYFWATHNPVICYYEPQIKKIRLFGATYIDVRYYDEDYGVLDITATFGNETHCVQMRYNSLSLDESGGFLFEMPEPEN